jgi:hypothetical protein
VVGVRDSVVTDSSYSSCGGVEGGFRLLLDIRDLKKLPWDDLPDELVSAPVSGVPDVECVRDEDKTVALELNICFVLDDLVDTDEDFDLAILRESSCCCCCCC